MALSSLLAALRRWWPVPVVLAVAAAAAVWLVSSSQPPMYTASAQGVVTVTDPQNRQPYALSDGAQYILDRMPSYAELGVTTPVLGPVVDDLGLQETPLSLSGRVTSYSMAGKAVLEMTASYNDPKIAADIADRMIAHVGRTISTLEGGNVRLDPIGAAAIPTQPSNGAAPINSAVAAAGGLVLGGFLAVLLHHLFPRRMRATREIAGQQTGTDTSGPDPEPDPVTEPHPVTEPEVVVSTDGERGG